MRSVGLSARLASSCAAAKLSIPISTRSLRHFTLYAAIAGAACELTDAQHLPFHVQLRKTNDIHATLPDERPMLHDRYVLSLSGVKHNPRAVFSAGDADRIARRGLDIGSSEPSHLTGCQSS